MAHPKRNARVAFRVLRRKLGKRLAKAGANNVGKATFKANGRKRRKKKRYSMRRYRKRRY